MTKKVAIIGSGVVGQSWALIFARGGCDVYIYDLVASQCDKALVGVGTQLEKLEPFQLLFGQTAKQVLARVHVSNNLDSAVAGTSYIQECVPESLSLKKKVFANIDKALAKDKNTTAVVASSSSNLRASTFTEELKHRGQMLVAHPVNPPFAIPVVEVVPAPWTSADIVRATQDLLTAVGQKPVLLKKEIDGFLVNRLQYALLAEAMRLVEDGIASPQDVDTTISHGLATRYSFMGPFQTIDLNAPNGTLDYFERYASSVQRVIKTQDNNRVIKQSTFDTISDAMRLETPLHRLSNRTAWRNARLVNLQVHKNNEDLCDKRSFAVPSDDVKSATLFVPAMTELKQMLKAALADNFAHVETNVVRCPDLREWGLPEAGLSGGNRLVDVGGVPNLNDVRYNDISFDLHDVAEKVDLPGAYIIGCAAAHNKVVGVNAEAMIAYHTGKKVNGSRYSKVLPGGVGFYDKYPARNFGLLGNLYASKGQTGDVIEVRAKVRTGEKNFVTCLREGLAKQVKGDNHIGMAGVFRVVQGKVKYHIMPQFKGKRMEEGPEVMEWLQFYEGGPGMTTLTYFLTGDPSQKKDMNLRLEHAHFFNDKLGEGGHYHYDTTPKEVEYLAYLVPAHKIYRVSDAFARL